jgi:hypothetical protein
MFCGLAVLLLSFFQNAGANEIDTTNRKPYSVFVHHQKDLQVNVGEKLLLDTYHVGQNKLRELEIFVNKQPLSDLPTKLATIQSPDNEQAVQFDRLTSPFPNTTWNVSLIWIGHTPGTYDLSLVVTDETGHKGEPIVQRIEVR